MNTRFLSFLMSLWLSCVCIKAQNIPVPTMWGAPSLKNAMALRRAALDSSVQRAVELKREVEETERQVGGLQARVNQKKTEYEIECAECARLFPNWNLGSVLNTDGMDEVTKKAAEAKAKHAKESKEELSALESELAKTVAELNEKQNALATAQAFSTMTEADLESLDLGKIREAAETETKKMKAEYALKFASSRKLKTKEARDSAMTVDRAQRDFAQRAIDIAERQDIEAWFAAANTPGWTCLWKGASSRATERFFEPFGTNEPKFLQSNILSCNFDKATSSLYSELYHDYFGPIRFGLGGALSNKNGEPSDSTGTSQDEESKNALAQRIIGAGGNLVANVGLPICSSVGRRGTVVFRALVQPKFGFDLQGMTADSSEAPYNADIGLETYLHLTGESGQIGLFISARPSVIIGNPLFYDRLDRGGYKPITMVQGRVGLVISNVARISYQFVTGDQFVTKTFGSQLSIQILTGGAGK